MYFLFRFRCNMKIMRSLLLNHAFVFMDEQDSRCTCNITELRSCSHCYSGKARSITYSESAFVALGIQHAIRMLDTCALSGCTVFFHIIL
jgi:hypothetical protein